MKRIVWHGQLAGGYSHTWAVLSPACTANIMAFNEVYFWWIARAGIDLSHIVASGFCNNFDEAEQALIAAWDTQVEVRE